MCSKTGQVTARSRRFSVPSSVAMVGEALEDLNCVDKVLDFGLAEIVGPHAEVGDDPTGNILDAGIEACSSEDRLTATGALLGTPHYVAPELIRQRSAGRASDLYSFGVIA